MRKKSTPIPLVLLLLIIACSDTSRQQPGPQHIYSTWTSLELDKCASFWLIKRFVDPQLQVKFHPKDTLEMEGINFDTPTSEYRRTHNLACFEVVMQKHNLKAPALDHIAALVHAIEIDYWHSQDNTPARDLNDRILEITQGDKPREQALEETYIVFDAIMDSFNK